MNKILTSILLIACVQLGFAQNILITDPDFDQTINPLDCNVYSDGAVTNFFDGGNSTGTYANNASDTITICPDPALGSKVSLAFGINAGFAWAVDSTDTLYVFDGPNVMSPLLGAYNSNNFPNGFNHQASFDNNPTGCLTVLFISDAADTADGWLANVTCGNPYQPFDLHMSAFKNGDPNDTLAPADTGYIDVCLGDSILFVANPDFLYASEVTGTGYSQNMSNVTVEWEFSDGSTLTGDSVWFTPPARQGYLATLKVTDAFPAVEYLMAKIRVSTKPIFDGIIVETDSICIGDTTVIIGGVTPADTVGVDPTSASFQLGGTFAGVTYLPDGSGANYSTDVGITGFTPGDTLTNPSDIAQLCVTMEHSYLGDLEMWIECPDGTTATIFNSYSGGVGVIPGGFDGSSTYLGDALDNNIGNPGTGWEYCFSSANATFGSMATEYANGNTVPTTISGGNAMNPNGVYLPEQSFNDLIGCPINGDWTLHIRDNLNTDDGYIFEWGIFFDPAINPNNESYAPVIINDLWTSTSTNIISGLNDTAITVVGQNQGTDLFTYQVEDDFGCFYDTTVSLVINPQPTIQMTITGNPTACPGDTVEISTSGSAAIPPYSYTWSNGASGTNGDITVNPVTDSLFIVTLTDWCNTQTVDTADISVPITLLESTTTLDSVICPGTNVPLNLSITGGSSPYTYEWSHGPTTETSNDNPGTSAIYILTVTDVCDQLLIDTAGIFVPSYDSLYIATTPNSDMLCPGETRLLVATPVGGAGFNHTYQWDNNTGNIDSISTITVTQDTTIVVTVTDGCGYNSTRTYQLEVPVYDEISILTSPAKFLICEGDTVNTTAIVSGGTGIYAYEWLGNGLVSNPEEPQTDLSPTDQLGFWVVATDECNEDDTVLVEILFDDCSVVAPSVFTPNGDGLNEVLHFTNLEKWPFNTLVIYDRWGKKIYEGNYKNDWDGGNKSDGVYYYVLNIDGSRSLQGYFHITR